MECRGRAGLIRLVAIARTYELLVVCFSFGLCVVLAFGILRFTAIPGLRTGLDWRILAGKGVLWGFCLKTGN